MKFRIMNYERSAKFNGFRGCDYVDLQGLLDRSIYPLRDVKQFEKDFNYHIESLISNNLFCGYVQIQKEDIDRNDVYNALSFFISTAKGIAQNNQDQRALNALESMHIDHRLYITNTLNATKQCTNPLREYYRNILANYMSNRIDKYKACLLLPKIFKIYFPEAYKAQEKSIKAETIKYCNWIKEELQDQSERFHGKVDSFKEFINIINTKSKVRVIDLEHTIDHRDEPNAKYITQYKTRFDKTDKGWRRGSGSNISPDYDLRDCGMDDIVSEVKSFFSESRYSNETKDVRIYS